MYKSKKCFKVAVYKRKIPTRLSRHISKYAIYEERHRSPTSVETSRLISETLACSEV